MTFKPARVLLALIAVVAIPAFAQNVAVVNGKSIPASRLEAVVKQVISQGQQPDSPGLRDAVKKDLIAREVMMQEAVKQGFEKDATVKSQMESAHQTIVINALVRDYMSKNPVSQADVKAEYERYKLQAGDKEYHVRHILVATEPEAKAVIAKLKGGAKFEDLAKTSLDTGTAANGGDLDWATPTSFPKVFSDAFIGLKKGAVTETAVQTPNGFHIIKLDDTRPIKMPAFDEVKGQIEEALAQKKLQAYQEAMVKKAKVQ